MFKKSYFIVGLLTLSLSFKVYCSDNLHLEVRDYFQIPNLLKFEIVGDNPVDRVILDCQSFVHGISIYQKEDEKYPDPTFHFTLYERECHEIHHYIVDQLENPWGEKVCLELSLMPYDYYLYTDTFCGPTE